MVGMLPALLLGLDVRSAAQRRTTRSPICWRHVAARSACLQPVRPPSRLGARGPSARHGVVVLCRSAEDFRSVVAAALGRKSRQGRYRVRRRLRRSALSISTASCSFSSMARDDALYTIVTTDTAGRARRFPPRAPTRSGFRYLSGKTYGRSGRGRSARHRRDAGKARPAGAPNPCARARRARVRRPVHAFHAGDDR